MYLSPVSTTTMSNNNYDSIKLVAVSPPIDVYGRVRQEPVTLVLRENLYADSPTDYAITDLNGDVVVTLKAKKHSATNKRSECTPADTANATAVVDSAGQELYEIHDKIFTVHASMVGKKEGVQLFKVEDESKAEGGARAKVLLSDVVTKSGSEQTMELDGDWAGDGAVLSFYDKDTKKPTQPVAKASRKSMTVKPGDYDDQTYFFTVAPGIDIALMAGIAVCFDEIRRGLEYGG